MSTISAGMIQGLPTTGNKIEMPVGHTFEINGGITGSGNLSIGNINATGTLSGTTISGTSITGSSLNITGSVTGDNFPKLKIFRFPQGWFYNTTSTTPVTGLTLNMTFPIGSKVGIVGSLACRKDDGGTWRLFYWRLYDNTTATVIADTGYNGVQSPNIGHRSISGYIDNWTTAETHSIAVQMWQYVGGTGKYGHATSASTADTTKDSITFYSETP